MFIKSITIQGFKSYRDETIIEPLSEQINLVVGRNGSGKSNFFSAIRFVLGDAYNTLQREQRQALLHEGISTTATLSAFVEIVFDNSDGRFPTGKEEVIIRRTVGSKKDEFSLDRKSTGKGEVMSLLESAGFSRSNPYYIVPQGRITHLTNQKDSERLDLLKEVAGTKVYEDRRAESVKIIQETDVKRNKIEELLNFIDERLAELEEEKKELKEFTTKDRERRCLEYSIYQKELQEVTDALDAIEDERSENIHNADAAREAFNQRQKAITSKENAIQDKRQALEVLRLELDQIVADKNESIKAQTQIECIVQDLKEASATSAAQSETLQAELNALQSQLDEKQAELGALLPRWSASVQSERDVKAKIEEASAKVAALYAKQGRQQQFTTQKDRDAFLALEIEKLQRQISEAESRMTETKSDLARTEESKVSTAEQLKEKAAVLDGRKEYLTNLTQEIQTLSSKQVELNDQRKVLYQTDTRVETLVRQARESLRQAESSLSSAMDKHTSIGLKSVMRIAEENQIEGVHGPLYSLFTVPEVYRQAAEVTAGNSLFHVVVENDGTATQLLDVMQKEKAGRVTFMPLNRLNPKPVDYPMHDRSVQPIIRKLRFDPKYTKAFEQVFSKTLVCENLEEATVAMRKYQLTVITTDGDKVDRKGAMTGGFNDSKRSRLAAAEQLKKWTTTLDSESAKQAETKRSLIKMDQEITRIRGQLQIADSKLKTAQTGREPLLADANALRVDLDRQESRSIKLQSALNDQESNLKALKLQLSSLQSEIATPMAQNLTSDELDMITYLSKQMEKDKKQLTELTKSSYELTGKKTILETEINVSLKRKLDGIKGRFESVNITAGEGVQGASAQDLLIREAELQSIANSIAALFTRMGDIEMKSEALKGEVAQLEKDLDHLRTQQSDDAKGISKQQKSIERYHSKKALLSQRREECNNNIRDLGVLPEEAFEKYIGEASDKLVKQLHKVNEALKKFAHVNKKAVEQYSNFTSQKESLTSRREELDKSAESIEDLVQVLDQRKDEAIQRTFKQVSMNFEEVFEKLVPAGRGRLIMQKRNDETEQNGVADSQEDDDIAEEEIGEREDESETDSDATPNKRKRKRPNPKEKRISPRSKKGKATKKDKSVIDSYTGVSIRVSFNSKVDEGLRIQQLSGGQKSLVALAVVFAIQKCDPAPFYLFDEIDANLDADRRTAIASMIKELSEDAQFIITTFRPELLQHADNFLGVIFDARKISTIKSLTQEDCYQFVEANEKTT